MHDEPARFAFQSADQGSLRERIGLTFGSAQRPPVSLSEVDRIRLRTRPGVRRPADRQCRIHRSHIDAKLERAPVFFSQTNLAFSIADVRSR